ncbi:MAG TPA: hypothetical protein VN661_11115 [Candidatus Acidoferrales bacterium]|nr:hypothetical protein [Candidatus Acidoferrales bacterium]
MRRVHNPLFAASDKDAYCRGECQAEHLTRVDPILVVNAEQSLFAHRKPYGIRLACTKVDG